MVAGIEVEKHATGDEMLNQQSEKQSFLNTRQNWIHENWSLPTTCNWIALGKLVTIYKFAASLFALHNLVAPCFCNFTSGTLASGKTRMVRRTSKFTIAWCMVAGIELEKHATGHEMSNQQAEKPHLPEHKTNLFPLGKTDHYALQTHFLLTFYNHFGPC